MTEDIVHEATYPHPPDLVWRALTTQDALRAWLMDNTLEKAEVGHRFRFMDKPKRIVGWDGVTECEVVEAAPPRRLVIRFGIDDGPTTVTFDLEPTPEGGTRLRFRHEGFSGAKGWLMRQGMNQGWGGMVRHSIPFVLDRLTRGEVPTREETTAIRKSGLRTEHAARRARS
jgi:uncharacterized protein YndB with AHSA1/START domain